MAEEGIRFQRDGEFAFARWVTPFENMSIDIGRVEYTLKKTLCVEILTSGNEPDYTATFQSVDGFRVMDEAGLSEIWSQTQLLKGRPGLSSFKVRNNLWTGESPLTFLATEGWSFILASDDDCVEIVCPNSPEVAAITGE